MGKIDPRVRRTRTKLRTAFMNLLTEKPLAEINIKDLTNAATITRGTFYLHYKDKKNFVNTIQKEILDEYLENAVFYVPLESTDENSEEPVQIPVVSLIHIFRYISKEKDFFSFLLREHNCDEFQLQFNKNLNKYIDEFLEKTEPARESTIPREMLINFLSFGCLAYAYTWLNGGMIYADHFTANNLKSLFDSKAVKDSGLENFFVFDASEIAGNKTLKDVNEQKD